MMRVETSTGPSTSFPDSPLGRLGTKLVDAINTGGHETFVGATISELSLRERPVSEFVRYLLTLHEQSGGVDLFKITILQKGLLEFKVRTRKGGKWARGYVLSDRGDETKILEFGFFPSQSPEFEEQNLWPTTAAGSEQAIVHEVERHVDLLAKHDIFSGVVLVSEKDRVIYQRAVGSAYKSFDVPNRIDTKFHLGSMNKMFTSLATAQLVEKGRLSFEDKIIDVLPEYPNTNAAKSISVHNLLTHTAGLGSLFEKASYDRGRKHETHESLLPVFASNPLMFEPGSKYSYSNEGYIVLGAIIERVTGENYHDYVRSRIFHPSGMRSTDAYALDETVPNMATGYARFEDDPLGLKPRRPNWMFLGWRGNAAGGGYSTAEDLIRFTRALREYRIVGKDLTEKLTSHQGLMPHYGYGFFVEEMNGKRVVGHGGGGPSSGINSDLKLFWDAGQTVIVLSNYDAPVAQDLCGNIANYLSVQ